MNENYTEIEIHVHPATPESGIYAVEARLDDGTPFQGEMRLDRTALRVLDHQGDDAGYGLALSKALFSDKIGKAFEQVLGRANATAGGRVRVRLWIDWKAAELQAIRWERFYHQPTGQEVVLAAAAKTPFSRFLGVSLPAAPAVTERPIRLLLAIANPAGLPKGLHPIDVEKEVVILHTALGNLKGSRTFEVAILPGRSGLSAELRSALQADGYKVEEGPTTRDSLLRSLPNYHVLHFLGHGHFKRKDKTGPGVAHLHLEDDAGNWQAVEDRELTTPLAAISPQPQLIFLAACESARTDRESVETEGQTTKTDVSDEHPFVGLAQKLVEAGVPAVVAMQDRVGMEQARQLVGDFYWHLHRHGLVDRALNEARNLLWAKEDAGWSIPALFMRLKDGRLFTPKAPSVRRGVSYDFLNPPEHYVARPFITQNLQEQLLSARGAPAVTLLHGMPASGKTTLAKALAQAVWDHFGDGVLWVTLGQKPEMLSLLGDLVEDLGSDKRPTTVGGAAQRLSTLLTDRQALLVLDDAWEYDHVAPFLVGGSRCHVLVTSRRSKVISDHPDDPFDYRLRVLTENQALEALIRLLGRTAATPFSDEEREQARALVNTVGGQPLALELVAGRIKGGSSWAELTRALEAEIADLDALEPDARRRLKGNLRVEASISVSLDWLRQEVESAWGNFVWLGALPEDATINPAAAAIWWQVESGRAADILEYLYDENLLLEVPPIQFGSKTWPAYRLHDLLHDVARRQLVAAEPQGLGFTFRGANQELLNRYKKLTNDGLWHTLPADGYIQANLTWHMEQAGQLQAIYRLLAEETKDGRNGRYLAPDPPDKGDAFAADVYRAWRLAEAAYEKGQDGLAIGRQCRYALLVSFLNSLAGNLPPELLQALVQYKKWSQQKALAYVEQIPDVRSRQKGPALELLAPLLRPEAMWQAFAATQTIDDMLVRDRALTALIPSLPETMLPQALTAARAVQGSGGQARALVALAKRLPEALMHEALVAAQAIEYVPDRAETLVTLAPHLPKAMLSHALGTAQAIKEREFRAQALAALTPRLPEEEQAEIVAQVRVDATQAIKYAWRPAEILNVMAPQLPEKERARIVAEALVAAQAIEYAPDQAEALAALIPWLPDEERTGIVAQALAAARTIQYAPKQAETLVALIPYLLDEERANIVAQALAVVQDIDDARDQAEFLTALVPHLPEKERAEQLAQALSAAEDIADVRSKARAITALVPHLPEEDRVELLGQALAVAQVIDDVRPRVETLIALIARLPEEERAELVPQALVAAQTVKDAGFRAEALKTLTSMASHLLEAELAETAAHAPVATQAIEPAWDRAKALANLAPSLSEEEWTQKVAEALAAAQTINDEGARAAALASLTPYLPAVLLANALAVAQAINYGWARAWVLTSLAPALTELPKDELYSLWCQALAALARRAREDILSDLKALLPVIEALGGREAIEETAQAVLDVGRWWP